MINDYRIGILKKDDKYFCKFSNSIPVNHISGKDFIAKNEEILLREIQDRLDSDRG